MKFGIQGEFITRQQISKNSPRKEGPRGNWLNLRASYPPITIKLIKNSNTNKQILKCTILMQVLYTQRINLTAKYLYNSYKATHRQNTSNTKQYNRIWAEGGFLQ